MSIFFTSDCHFGHRKILTMGNGRPFDTIEEHDKALIDNWNKKIVSNNDIVYVLGDMFWNYNSKQIKETLSQLNGKKYLILGNHDRINHNEKSDSWEDITPYMELTIDNDVIILCHYPIAEWKHCFRGSYHLHGHTHGTFDYSNHNYPHNNHNIYDVGVDTNDFEPKSWEEIKESIIKRNSMRNEK